MYGCIAENRVDNIYQTAYLDVQGKCTKGILQIQYICTTVLMVIIVALCSRFCRWILDSLELVDY